MTALQKFMFDLDFDEPPPPEPMVDDAMVEIEEAPPPPPTFSEEEMAEARERARAEGHAAGVLEAAQVTERRHADALTAIATGLREVLKVQRAALQQRHEEALDLAVAILRKTMPEMTRLHGVEEIAGVLRECLLQLDSQARVTVRVAPALLDEVRASSQRVADEAEFEGKLLYHPDPNLKPGDCRVEWGDGGADRDLTLLWTEIDAILARTAENWRNTNAAPR